MKGVQIDILDQSNGDYRKKNIKICGKPARLVMILCVVAIVGFWYVTSRTPDLTTASSSTKSLRIADPPFPHLRNLVMVAGHAVYKAHEFTPDVSKLESSWILQDYQNVPGQAASFLEMIREGVLLAAEDEKSLLLFSGGITRQGVPLSEAESYWRVADGANWFELDDVRARAAGEDYARDSYENTIFSICRFKELTGRYPQNVTVASYSFKKSRFQHLHRKAINFPLERFFFSGTPAIGHPHVETAFHLRGRQKGEAAVVEQFKHDLYGCSPQMQAKRQHRNPYARTIPYDISCPELRGLLEWCGPQVYPVSLPWRDTSIKDPIRIDHIN